jgi:pilus assembly protein CpaF
MRPDRIIVGEVRGEESFDMLQAMNTGHDGSLTTIHANSPRDALMRLETMVAMANFDIPADFVRRYVSSALDVIIQVARLADGSRKLVSLQEITGMEGNMITLQELFAFQQRASSNGDKVEGAFVCKGIRPRFMDRVKMSGVTVPHDIFDPTKVVEV